MPVSDPIADLLTRLRNAAGVGKPKFDVPYSKMKGELVRILKREGYIADYELDTTGGYPVLHVENKFVNKTAAVAGLKRVSKPGLRKYVSSTEIPRVLGGMGIAILSTSSGVMTGQEAKRKNVGGELLAFVW
ncbi:MAG: 30S ribosomal protein S8 [Terrimicrobiaceae bacterium]|nr:30S ribosomal protein S8 [Terrimicrobiaceae bacterium]